MTDVDTVANAMTRVCWQGHLTFDDYLRMAQAAIDALGLTKEKRVTAAPLPGENLPVKHFHRFVSEWITTDD